MTLDIKGVDGSGAQFRTITNLEKFCDAVMAKSEKLYPAQIYDLAEKSRTGALGEDASGPGRLIVDERYRQTGRLFPLGSFGHCGHTGTSFFFSREKYMYAVLLTNATRCLWLKGNYSYGYGVV